MDPLLVQLKVEESRKAALTHELATLVDLARVTSLETKRIQEALVREAARMRDLLGRHVPRVRRLLRTLVADLSLLFNHRGCSWGTMSGWRSSAPLLTQGGH
jgi:hypothetical protein